MPILLFVIKTQLRKLIIVSIAIILYLFVTSSKMWQKLKRQVKTHKRKVLSEIFFSEVPRPKKHFQFSSKDYKFILTWSEAYGGLTYGLSEVLLLTTLKVNNLELFRVLLASRAAQSPDAILPLIEIF